MAGIIRRFRQKAISKAVENKKNRLDRRFLKARDAFLKTGPEIMKLTRSKKGFEEGLKSRVSSPEILAFFQKELHETVKRLKRRNASAASLGKRLQRIERRRQKPKSTGLVGLLRYLSAPPIAHWRVRKIRQIRKAQNGPRGKKQLLFF